MMALEFAVHEAVHSDVSAAGGGSDPEPVGLA
jgi:hypothetical protein